MSKIMVARNGEDVGSYTQVEIEHLKESNFLFPDDHYWMDGMPEWRPLTELVPPTALVVRQSAPPVRVRPIRMHPEPLPRQPIAQPQQPIVVHVVNNNNSSANSRGPTAIVVGGGKSGLFAAFLNLLIPGLGYMYCGRVFLGIIAFIFTVVIVVVTFGVGALVMYPILIIDGFLCAGRANRRIVYIQ
jgi:TM2 domain-containing membrane protein YozV